jgi:hypothetical protein
MTKAENYVTIDYNGYVQTSEISWLETGGLLNSVCNPIFYNKLNIKLHVF